MRIAIIGATGMLGQHTALAAAAAGHELVLVYRNPKSLERLGDLQYEARRADLEHRATLVRALDGVDAVINAAAYYPTLPRPWREEITTATQQMANFYAACAEHPLKKIVYVGGAIALPRQPDGLPGDETLEYPGPPANKAPYLQVKWALDLQAREQVKKGLPVAIGIPTMSFGEFDAGPTTGRLIVEIANRQLPGYVRGKRNVVYAGDAGRGLVRVCEDGRPGERYLLGGCNMTMDELVETIARVTGAPAPRAVPLGAAQLLSRLQGARYRWLKGPPPKIDRTALTVMAAGQFLSGDKAERELDYRAEVAIDDAIARALHWFQAAGYVG
jgi:dihydroflavonol-4-reductase